MSDSWVDVFLKLVKEGEEEESKRSKDDTSGSHSASSSDSKEADSAQIDYKVQPIKTAMEQKKQRELEKRNGTKPFHHIDACILTEMLLQQERMKDCIRYLNKFPNYRKGGISTLSMGEILTAIVVGFGNDTRPKINALEVLDSALSMRKIGIVPLSNDVLVHARSIRELDSRIDASDAINMACAVDDGADVFVTFDEKLLNNQRFEKQFKMKISSPSMLV